MHTFAHVAGVRGSRQSPRPPALNALTLIAAILLGACSTPPQDARLLTLAYTEGGVTTLRGGSPADATRGETLAAGDEITTGPDGLATLQLDDGTLLVVTGGGWLTVQALDGTKDKPVSHFYLHGGSLFTFHHGELPADASYLVETPQGSASIQGSSMGLTYVPGVGATISCLEGMCGYRALRGQALARIPVHEGEWVNHNDGGVSDPAPMDAALRHEWDFALAILGRAGMDYRADPICRCDSSGTWICKGEPPVKGADQCAECACGPSGTPNAANLQCNNGTIFRDAPSCFAAMKCSCLRTSLECISTSAPIDGRTFDTYFTIPDHPSCKGVTCACGGPTGADFICSNGDVRPNLLYCEVCRCEGKDVVCNTGRVFPGVCAFPTPTSIPATDTPKPKERDCGGPNDPC